MLRLEGAGFFHFGDGVHAADVFVQVFLLVAEPAVPDAFDIVPFTGIAEVAVILRVEGGLGGVREGGEG